MHLGLSLGVTGGGQGRGESPPSALGWPAKYPFTPVKTADGWTANVNARGFVPGPFGSSATVYWVRPTGNNANDGLSEGAAKRAIHSAITAGNATGGPYRINIEGGDYSRLNGFLSTSGTVRPTQPVAVVGYGGAVVTGAWDDLTWADDGSGTSTYSATVSNAARVLDRLNTNANGSLNDLTLVADIATVRTTLGAYVVSGGVIYVRRADLAAVTTTNTRVFRATPSTDFTAVTSDVYLEGIEVQGGSSALRVMGQVARNLVAVDCAFNYSGSTVSLTDGVAIDNMTGLALFVRCTVRANAKDGFNFHQLAGGPTYGLLIDCIGIDNGRFTSTSNNGLTLHESVIGVDIGGTYSLSVGTNLHNINTSKMWCLGTTCSDCKSDGSLTPSDFRAGNTALLWLQDCTASVTAASLIADTGATIYKRNVTIAGTEIGGGTITTF